jgi:hypothetical protein
MMAAAFDTKPGQKTFNDFFNTRAGSGQVAGTRSIADQVTRGSKQKG